MIPVTLTGLFTPARLSAKLAEAHILAEWLASPEGQAAIAAVTIAGETLFNPGVREIR